MAAAPPPRSPPRWVLADGGAPTGEADLRARLADGRAGPRTLVRNQYLPAPVPLYSVRPLAEALGVELDGGGGGGDGAADGALAAGWHAALEAGRRVGPVSMAALLALARQGDLRGGSLVWHASFGADAPWRAAMAVERLATSGVLQDGDGGGGGGGGDGGGGGENDTGGGGGEAAAADACWYYAESGGERKGPVPRAGLPRGRPEQTLVWRAGMPEWRPLADVERREERRREQKREYRKRRQRAAKGLCAVYVTGVPAGATVPELAEFFRRAGVLERDPAGQPRVRLYTDDEGRPKGDALVTYLAAESVPLAVQILDGAPLRADGTALAVRPAKFEGGGGGGSGAPPAAKRARAGGAPVPRADQRRALRWAADDEEGGRERGGTRGLRIVVLTNAFDASPGAAAPPPYARLRDELARALHDEAGEVEKLTVFEGSPAGAVAVKFRLPAGAERCLGRFHGRRLLGRTLRAAYYDGVTNYKVGESAASEARRRDDFGRWLEGGSGDAKN